MTREFTEEDHWNEREACFVKELYRYTSWQNASIERTFLIFSRLPVDKRQQILKKTDYDFFHVLLKNDLQIQIYQILNGTNEIEKKQMWSIIHKNLKQGLINAIEDGNLAGIIYHMESFPSKKTHKIIESILMNNDGALLKTVIREAHPRIVQYFLEHESTKKKMNSLGCHIKPSQTYPLESPCQATCINIKSRLKALFLGREVKVCPDSPTIENSVSTKTDRGSSF